MVCVGSSALRSAGESVGQTKRLMSAASIIDEMINGAEAVIGKPLGSMVVD